MNRAFEFHEYTASSFADLVGYGKAGWQLVAVMPYEERPPTSFKLRYTFFLQREYILEAREWFVGDPEKFDTMIPVFKGMGDAPDNYIKVREVIDEQTEKSIKR